MIPPSFEDLLCDSSEDEDEHQRRKAKGKRAAPKKGGSKAAGKGGSWIREASGEEPLNFLDSSVARSVISESVAGFLLTEWPLCTP